MKKNLKKYSGKKIERENFLKKLENIFRKKMKNGKKFSEKISGSICKKCGWVMETPVYSYDFVALCSINEKKNPGKKKD